MITNEDLIAKLLQYPKDAVIVYSYINPIGEDVEVEPEPYFNESSHKIYL